VAPPQAATEAVVRDADFMRILDRLRRIESDVDWLIAEVVNLADRQRRRESLPECEALRYRPDREPR
jgi:tetrahydromethanopterin S-methyltransferase subunit G